jgi:hypothetical protein
MFEPYSKNYLLGEFAAYPDQRRAPAINQTIYREALDYVAGPPMMMKHDETAFEVTGDARVARREIAMPVELLERLSLSIGFTPEKTVFLVARNDHAQQLATLGV